jgi:hypothetical protein
MCMFKCSNFRCFSFNKYSVRLETINAWQLTLNRPVVMTVSVSANGPFVTHFKFLYAVWSGYIKDNISQIPTRYNCYTTKYSPYINNYVLGKASCHMCHIMTLNFLVMGSSVTHFKLMWTVLSDDRACCMILSDWLLSSFTYILTSK